MSIQPKIPTLAKSGMLFIANLIKHKRRRERIRATRKPEYIVIHLNKHDRERV